MLGHRVREPVRLALLSDVHANLHALEAVMADVRDQGPDAICFLGDAVGYNAHPRECLRELEATCQVSIQGNHDQAVLEGGEEWFNDAARAGVEHSRRELTDKDLATLASWGRQAEIAGTHLVHASPRAPTTEYVFPDIHPEALEEIVRHPSVGDARIVAMGHTHVPFVKHVAELLVINVGSVGQPRDGDPRACWCLVDTEGPSADHRRVDYDIEGAAQAVRDAGLPARLATRLYDGM